MGMSGSLSLEKGMDIGVGNSMITLQSENLESTFYLHLRDRQALLDLYNALGTALEADHD